MIRSSLTVMKVCSRSIIMRAKQKKLPLLNIHDIPQILLLGNGINRVFQGFSWSEMIAGLGYRPFSMQEKRAIASLPYPLQTVIATGDRIDTQLMEHAQRYDRPLPPAQRDLLAQFTAMDWDAILTTNYTFEIEKALQPSFSCRNHGWGPYCFRTRERDREEILFALHQYYECGTTECRQRIWHIHGDLTQPDSMILGHYYYGNAISRLHDYMQRFHERWRVAYRQSRVFRPLSWMDYFMLGDVSIVGLGMDFSESDLWWLVSAKKMFGQGTIHLHYATDEQFKSSEGEREVYLRKTLAKKLLCETYGIAYDPVSLTVHDYHAYYCTLAAQIRSERSGKIHPSGIE